MPPCSPTYMPYANLLGWVDREDISDPNPGIVKPKHSHVRILVFRGIICYCTTLLLLVLGLGRLGFACGGGRITLVPCVSTGYCIITGSVWIVVLSSMLVVTRGCIVS